MAQVLRHDLRVRIVDAAHRRPTVSAAQLAAELGMPISNVAYHLRRLCTLHVLELDRETRVRGALCRHYRLSPDGVRVGRRGALLSAMRDVAETAQAVATTPSAVVQVTHREVGLDREAHAQLASEVRRVACLVDELEAATRRRGGDARPVTVALLIAASGPG